MTIGWPVAVAMSALVLAAGCASDHGRSPGPHPIPASPRAFDVHGWPAMTSEAKPRTRPVTCAPPAAPGVTVRLRVPVDYRRLSNTGRTGCTWEAPDAIVAQVRVELSARSLAQEAVDGSDPAKNGQDAGNSQEAARHVRLSRRSVFGQPGGELLSYLADDEGVPVQVREARVAPVTVSMSVSSDGRRLYAVAAADFRAVMGSLAVETGRTS